MNFASYLYHGANGPNQRLCRSQYPKDMIQSVGTSNKFHGTLGTVTKLGETQQEAVIDSAVKVTTVAQKIRDQAKHFWNRMKNSSYITFTAFLVTGILAGGAAIAVGAALPELWVVAAAVGTAALVILGIAGFVLSRAIAADKRLSEWKKDPIVTTQNNRKNVGLEGFYKAFASKYKGSIVSGEELQRLWSEDMDRYVDRFTNGGLLRDSTKVSMVREFIKKSPIGNAALNYTFDVVEAPIHQVNTKFESVKSSADAIKRQSRILKEKINSKRRSALRDNDSRRDALLLPYRRMVEPQQFRLTSEINRLRMSLAGQRNRVSQLSVRNARPTTVVGRRGHVIPNQRVVLMQVHQDIQMGEMRLRQLEGELSNINMIYRAMTLPILHMHARNESKIRHWASGEIKKIEMDEDKLMKKFFNPIQEILREYANRDKEQPIKVVKIQEEVEVLNLETPPLEVKYEPVQYSDSWQGVIEEFEWKKKQAEIDSDQLLPSSMN
jgi:hypothetical protein